MWPVHVAMGSHEVGESFRTEIVWTVQGNWIVPPVHTLRKSLEDVPVCGVVNNEKIAVHGSCRQQSFGPAGPLAPNVVSQHRRPSQA